MWREVDGYEYEIEYKIGDLADEANDGRDPNPYHDRILGRIARHMRGDGDGWSDIRREQAQVAGGAGAAVMATEPPRSGSRYRGINFPDLSGVYRGRRIHVEVDTDANASRAHQRRIFAADRNPALGVRARQAQGVFVVIDRDTGRVTSVRHVMYGQEPREIAYGHRGVPMQQLLNMGVLTRPVTHQMLARSTQGRTRQLAAPGRRPASLRQRPNARRLRQRELETEQDLGREAFFRVRAVVTSRPLLTTRGRPLRVGPAIRGADVRSQLWGTSSGIFLTGASEVQARNWATQQAARFGGRVVPAERHGQGRWHTHIELPGGMRSGHIFWGPPPPGDFFN